jgi:hypothetical protein
MNLRVAIATTLAISDNLSRKKRGQINPSVTIRATRCTNSRPHFAHLPSREAELSLLLP